MVSLTGNVTVDEDGSAEFRCEIDANPMNKGQLISKDIIFGVNSFKKITQKFVKHCPDCTFKGKSGYDLKSLSYQICYLTCFNLTFKKRRKSHHTAF